MNAPPIDYVKHAATCTRCGKHLVLEQDPECPPLVIEKWMKIIVCNRCGKYLESYRRLDDAIAYVCNQWSLVMHKQAGHEVRGALRDKLTQLTKELQRLICERWNTTNEWCEDWVDFLIEQPHKSRMASKGQETLHRKARENADKERV